VLSPADIYFAAIAIGFLLLCAEFCFPGRIFPAMAGSIFALGGGWRLFHLNHPFSALHFGIAVPLGLLVIAVLVGLLRIAAAGRSRKRNPDDSLQVIP
jgi:membrane protein implicated in regulation of membrane protease activity